MSNSNNWQKNLKRNRNFGIGVAGRFRHVNPLDFEGQQNLRSQHRRVNRASDLGQQFMRDQARLDHLMEQMLILRSPIQLPDPKEE